MAITFTNNWKNIIDKLESTLRTEFKGALPVYRGNKVATATTFLRLVPTGSSLLEYNATSESREFSIQMIYYFFEKNIKDTALDHILRTVSRIEALIHDNTVMTLTDSSNAYNCRFESTDLNADEESGIYITEWAWKCQHLGNIG